MGEACLKDRWGLVINQIWRSERELDSGMNLSLGNRVLVLPLSRTDDMHLGSEG